MEPLKRNAEFKEIFLKTMLQSPLPGKNHKKMTVVAQDDGKLLSAFSYSH